MHSLRRSRFGALAAGSIVLSGLGANVAIAAPTPSTATVVTGSAAWYPQAYDNTANGVYLTPQQRDETGPQRAPLRDQQPQDHDR
ncbi:hypothetical protein KRR39_05960 [Nocardioides panacis]|uniref:Uncharacterized protein n=1 Tax=Nocardioides panacis TaxID=2849501 RepID=A0A975T0F0_9ACTN|nr:hypothetical protein [Nocardioides panacis]QWZ09325.1 hypothetical protein KRR39_05960 [Nocardioides panacis]